MTTVSGFSVRGSRGAQGPNTQPVMTTERGQARRAELPLPLREADLVCRRLTGLPVKRASICVGRLLNVYLGSRLGVDSVLRAGLLPLRDCTPGQLRECTEVLIKRHPDLRATAGWALHLLGELTAVLDWKIVLAHVRFPDPTLAEWADGLVRARLRQLFARDGQQ